MGRGVSAATGVIYALGAAADSRSGAGADRVAGPGLDREHERPDAAAGESTGRHGGSDGVPARLRAGDELLHADAAAAGCGLGGDGALGGNSGAAGGHDSAAATGAAASEPVLAAEAEDRRMPAEAASGGSSAPAEERVWRSGSGVDAGFAGSRAAALGDPRVPRALYARRAGAL